MNNLFLLGFVAFTTMLFLALYTGRGEEERIMLAMKAIIRLLHLIIGAIILNILFAKGIPLSLVRAIISSG